MTQREKIANRLMNGFSLTPLQALKMFGSLRLSAVIFDLKNEGWDIKSKLVKVKTRNGTSRVSRYWIDKK